MESRRGFRLLGRSVYPWRNGGSCCYHWVAFYPTACLSSYQRTAIYPSIAVVTQTAAGAHVSFFTPRINQFTGVVGVFPLCRPSPANADLRHSSSAVPRLSSCTITPLPNPAICGSSLLKRTVPVLYSSEVAKYCLASPVPHR